MHLHLDGWWENGLDNQNTPKFPRIDIWYLEAFWRYLRIIWVIYNVFIK